MVLAGSRTTVSVDVEKARAKKLFFLHREVLSSVLELIIAVVVGLRIYKRARY